MKAIGSVVAEPAAVQVAQAPHTPHELLSWETAFSALCSLRTLLCNRWTAFLPRSFSKINTHWETCQSPSPDSVSWSPVFFARVSLPQSLMRFSMSISSWPLTWVPGCVSVAGFPRTPMAPLLPPASVWSAYPTSTSFCQQPFSSKTQSSHFYWFPFDRQHFMTAAVFWILF